jgi:hypothetical protein
MDRSGWSTPVRGFAAFWVNDFLSFVFLSVFPDNHSFTMPINVEADQF